MNRKRTIYLTDLAMVPLFILTLYSGVKLHMAGHDPDHESWPHWALFHTVSGALFTLFVTIHIVSHRAWFKGVMAKRIKGRITVALSVVFILTIITGVLLLCIVEANSVSGLWHYKTGLATGALGLAHLLRRRRFFYRAPKRPTAF